jgi:hypothetical protein
MKMKLTKSNKRSLEVGVFFMLPMMVFGVGGVLLLEELLRGLLS